MGRYGAIGVARALSPVQPGVFRLFLATLVFVVHFSSLALGAYAVFVFFILSGVWVQRMWTARYRQTRLPYLTFMVSRLWRLAPVMLLVSGFTLVVMAALGLPLDGLRRDGVPHLLFSTTFLLGYYTLPFQPVGSAWSLDIEMQFYLVAPLLATVATRVRAAWLLVAAFLCSIAGVWLLSGALLPSYLFFFVIGMAAAVNEWRPTARLAWSSAGVTAAIVVAIALSPWPDLLFGGTHAGPLQFYNVHLNIVLAVLSAPFAVFTTRQPSEPADRMFADLSYVVYLLHWSAMLWFHTVQGSILTRLPVAAASFVLVPAAAWLIWRFVDRPLNRARTRWVTGRVSPEPDVTAEP